MKKRITVASAVVAAAAAVTSALLARRARFFAQAPPQRNETFATSAGPVELPVRYHDGSLMGAFWLVEETRAAELLPDNLEPLLLPGRNAAAGLFMMDYRNSTLGPYGEVGIGIQAVRKGTGATLIGYLWDIRNAARELRAGPGADPARRRPLPHRRLSGLGGLRDLEY